MDNVKLYSSFIKRIVTSPDPIRIKLLKSSNLKIITAISEIVYNIIYKNIKVPTSTIVQLIKFKRVFNKLISELMTSYNSAPHRSLGVSPMQVTEDNEHELWLRQERRGPHRKTLLQFLE